MPLRRCRCRSRISVPRHDGGTGLGVVVTCFLRHVGLVRSGRVVVIQPLEAAPRLMPLPLAVGAGAHAAALVVAIIAGAERPVRGSGVKVMAAAAAFA